MIPKWYSSFHIYIDFQKEVMEEYKKITKIKHENYDNNFFEFGKSVISIATNISRIIPFSVSEKKGTVKIVNNFNINYLTQFLSFVGDDLRKIINVHNNLLFRLGLLRNKYEHVPHLIDDVFIFGSVADATFGFELPDRKGEILKIKLETREISKLIIDINDIIIKVIGEILNEVAIKYENLLDTPYYNWLIKIKNNLI